MKRVIVNIVERSVADITSPFARKRTDPLFNIAQSENQTVTLCTKEEDAALSRLF